MAAAGAILIVEESLSPKRREVKDAPRSVMIQGVGDCLNVQNGSTELMEHESVQASLMRFTPPPEREIVQVLSRAKQKREDVALPQCSR